jgi:predicted RNA binding protein YcfA (HicA-like mRNA interferase family)
VYANELVSLLKRYGYNVIRQTGSHIRLTKELNDGEHIITVPNHKPIKIGTLQNIAKDVCAVNNVCINEFYQKL